MSDDLVVAVVLDGGRLPPWAKETRFRSQKTFLIESIKITIFMRKNVLMVDNEILPESKNIFHKGEIIHNSAQSRVADDQLRAVAYDSH